MIKPFGNLLPVAKKLLEKKSQGTPLEYVTEHVLRALNFLIAYNFTLSLFNAIMLSLLPIEGFHMTSYQSKFCKSYQRPPCQVSSLNRRVLGKTTKCSINTFYLVHTTLPNYNRVTRISAHSHTLVYKFFHEVNPKLDLFFLFFSIPRSTKENQEMLQSRARTLGAYRVVQTVFSFYSIQEFELRHCASSY